MSKLIESSEYLHAKVVSMYVAQGIMHDFLLDLQAPQAFGVEVPQEIKQRALYLLEMTGGADG